MSKFDLQKTSELLRLFKVAKDERDANWLKQFLPVVLDASLACHNPQVIRGPDGFSYFALTTPPIKQEFQSYCVSHILDHCTEKGLGIVINPSATGVDWVFTYGNLWSLRQFGTLDGDPHDEIDQNSSGTNVHTSQGEEILLAAPSEDFFPPYARIILREMLKQFGVPSPECLLMVNPKMQPNRNIIFNVFRDLFKEEKDFTQFAYRFRWFLPPKMGIVFVDSKADLGKHFKAF